MRAQALLLLTVAACTDPLAGNWQSHGPFPRIGDFEIFLDDDLLGHIDFSERSMTGTQSRVEQEVEAVLFEREDGIWNYTIEIEDEPDLDCYLNRRIDELTCEWGEIDLEFEVYEEDDTTCENACELGAPLRSTCNACIASICNLDKFCCAKAWDAHCKSQLPQECGIVCP